MFSLGSLQVDARLLLIGVAGAAVGDLFQYKRKNALAILKEIKEIAQKIEVIESESDDLDKPLAVAERVGIEALIKEYKEKQFPITDDVKTVFSYWQKFIQGGDSKDFFLTKVLTVIELPITHFEVKKWAYTALGFMGAMATYALLPQMIVSVRNFSL